MERAFDKIATSMLSSACNGTSTWHNPVIPLKCVCSGYLSPARPARTLAQGRAIIRLFRGALVSAPATYCNE